MRRPGGVVFDLDGTLLETEKLARRCFERACEDIEWSIDAAVYDRCIGATHEATEAIIRDACGDKFPYTALEERWSYHYHQVIANEPVDKKPGVVALLERLRELKIPVAVATSSFRSTVELKLAMAELDHYFEFLVCGGEAGPGKPHPGPYLRAVERLGLTAGYCWAVEDSDNGVRSAVGAGLTVFQIPDELTPAQDVRDFGHEILPSALEILPLLQ